MAERKRRPARRGGSRAVHHGFNFTSPGLCPDGENFRPKSRRKIVRPLFARPIGPLTAYDHSHSELQVLKIIHSP